MQCPVLPIETGHSLFSATALALLGVCGARTMNAALVRLEPLLLATGEGATMLGCVLAVILIAALGTKDAARQHDRFMTFWIGVAFFVAYAFLGYVGFALAGIVIWRQYTTDPLQRRDHVRKAGSVVAILAALTLIGAVIKW